MADKSFSSELQRAQARPDLADLQRQTRIYYEHWKRRFVEDTDEHAADLDTVYESRLDDPDRALAYIMLAAATYDDPEYLAFIGAGLLEDLLREPAPGILERIVQEARKTARFRWLLSVPYRVAISEEAWEAIRRFRIAGQHEEPAGDTLPPRPWV